MSILHSYLKNNKHQFVSFGKSILFVLLSLLILQSCKQAELPTDLAIQSIIPKPVSVVASGKRFSLTSNAKIFVGSPELMGIGNYLSTEFNKMTSLSLVTEPTSEAPGNGNIYLVLGNADAKVGAEGYELEITEEMITVKANEPAGLYMGVQTIIQLIPNVKAKSQNDSYGIPTGTIIDYPTYAWRGSMLDVARHFFSVEDVKRYIDLISYYKMNILHLHLSDDQGWRIEIKSWPNLALHGGKTQVGGGTGGYYTQEQYKDIVAYAASKYITIVPEIDLPGHINSALASYGELNGGIKFPIEGGYNSPTKTTEVLGGKNKPTQLYTGIEVGWSTLYFDKPETFKFVNDVIRELSEITPGPYVHIGGDEAHATKKEDYIKFINRFTEIVKANGKKMIGWEEIAQANIDGNAIAQHWDKPTYAQMAADKGAQIIMSPSKRVYIDMQYDSTSKLGLHWAAYIEVDDAYNWDPATQVEGISREQILGVETPLWSETISTMDDIEYLLFPRMPGIAEIAWSPAEGRTWEEYKVRLGNHAPFMRTRGIDFYPSARVNWAK
ncbi:MAG: beta-N-acetylhexosaminidase [Cyclobacteriaceae bacterium]|nr:beta-N-acetylhexosaminidase [Cyclobacteriaceae bacterium]